MTDRSRAALTRSPPSAPRPADSAQPTTLQAPRNAPRRSTAPASRPLAEPLHLKIEFGWRIADTYLVLAALAAAEVVIVGLVAFREFVWVHEFGWATKFLLPIALVVAAPCAVVAAIFIELVVRATTPPLRAAVASFLAAGAGAVAFGISSGRMFEHGRRLPFVAASVVLTFVIAFFAAPWLARTLARITLASSSPDRRWWLHHRWWLLVALATLMLELANAHILPRLYPAFHLGLVALTLLTASFATLSLARHISKGVRVVLALVVFTAATAFTPRGASRLSRADNLRFIYLNHAPLLANVVHFAARLSPPAPLDDALPDETTAETSPTDRSPTLSFRGRDLVLITIDALRADHVGAYGYTRPTTPNLDKLAEQGLVFEAAYTSTPHTSYALASLMTGKYMRPLALQGLGANAETWAQHLRHYGYKTAAFYPPAVFFIEGERLAELRDRAFDFEYKKIEFATVSARLDQVRDYLQQVAPTDRFFLWVHLFEPHEPYQAHPEYPFGDRDIDRYDAEVKAADWGVGAILQEVRNVRPDAVAIVTADHGEEFNEHGGRYHGTTVYEEQVRVPLVIHAPQSPQPRRITAPVQLIDLLPTVLAGLDVPRPARIRGFDLASRLTQDAHSPQVATPSGDLAGFAFAETDEQTLLAKGPFRLVCARKVGACVAYDVATDPGETKDISILYPAQTAKLRSDLRAIEASHGRFEMRGLRNEGKGWPDALRRGIAGDADAAVEVAALLDDADVAIRRKAAEVLFSLKRPDAASALRLALVRDEDQEVRRWSALTLTRLGEGAPLTRELLVQREQRWQRLAALALAEAGDGRGEDILVAWLREAVGTMQKDDMGTHGSERSGLSLDRMRELMDATAKIHAKAALLPLTHALDDVRLRPYVASALAQLDEDAARPVLAERLATEASQTNRIALTEALIKLGAGPELAAPLARFLGTPDPLPNGLNLALRAGVFERVGGPRERELHRLQRFATSGVGLGVIIPEGGNGKGLRVLCRARANEDRPGEIRFGVRIRRGPSRRDRTSLVPADAPELDRQRAVTLQIPATSDLLEVFATLPATVRARPGEHGDFMVYATQNVDVTACAVVPLSDDQQ